MRVVKLLTVFFFLIITSLLIPISIKAQVLINEFSSSTSSDWVEIYNIGTLTVNLSQYLLRDSTTTNKKILSGQLPQYGFAAFDFSNRLNKDKDVVKLVKLNGESEILVDSIPYGIEGEVCAVDNATGSIGRVTDGGNTIERFKVATESLSNSGSELDPCPTPTPIVTNTHTPTPEPTNGRFPTPTNTTSTSVVLALKPTSTSVINIESEDETEESQTLGIIDVHSTTGIPTAEPQRNIQTTKKFPVLVLGFIIPAMASIIYAIYWFVSRKNIN